MLEDVVVILIKIINKILNKFLRKVNNNSNAMQTTIYSTKKIMTDSELNFFNKLKYFESDYRVIPQLNLATVIKKINNNRYASELFRNIDFAIFSKDYSTLLLLIELNDRTHETKSRQKRDIKVKNICKEANIKLITFYTKYPNEEKYIINRIINELNNNANNTLNMNNINQIDNTING